MNQDKIRLQVFLSHNGVCSRRKAMTLIQEGRVKVNGRIIVEPSTPIDLNQDEVAVDNKEVRREEYVYVLLNKPRGVTTTKEDRFAPETVLKLLPAEYQYLSPVGRLDKDTEGLLLLTNDGDLAYRLTHPKFNIEKTYFVRVEGVLADSDIKKLERGIWLDQKKTSPSRIKDVVRGNSATEFVMIIHEGWNRQIRRMLAKVGKHVVYLKRLAQGPLRLGNLKAGEWRELKKEEIILGRR